MKKEIVFLDTETTGLYNADAIEISVISLNHTGEKSYLFNSKIKTQKEITKEAFNVHNISIEDLKTAPNFKEVYDDLKEVLKNKIVIIYNKGFDLNILNNMCFDIGKEAILNSEDCFCLMELYAVWYGEFNSYFGSYKWQKLTSAFSNLCGNYKEEKIIPHSALGDCIMSKQVFICLFKNLKPSYTTEEFADVYNTLYRKFY